ncbi:MAG: ATP-binding cassette domain-containing protein, partial [Chloroflexi bacterium]|nr:ATP-binding cassette domain-containing protein [Chloroflexota bacterium]
VTVLRRGHVVGEVERPFSTQTVVRLMFGQALPRVAHPAFDVGETRLHVRDLSVADHRLRLDGVCFDVRAGEVVGFAGLEGSGQGLVLRACGGLLKPLHGRIELDKRNLVGKHYRTFLESGIAYLPAGRLDEGLAAGLDLSEHFELARRSRDVLIDLSRARAIADSKIREYNIRGTAESAVESLSGGNQQRALLALLPVELKLLLLEQPTRGLDIESAQWVWTQLMARRAHGTAIIFISADLDEVLTYADQVIVFSGGHVSASVPARATTVEEIGNLIAGKQYAKV